MPAKKGCVRKADAVFFYNPSKISWIDHGRLAGSNHGPTQSGSIPPGPLYWLRCIYMVFYGIVAILVPVDGWLRDFTGETTASVVFGGVLMILTVAALTTFRILQRRWPAEEPEQLLESTT